MKRISMLLVVAVCMSTLAFAGPHNYGTFSSNEFLPNLFCPGCDFNAGTPAHRSRPIS